MRMFLQRLAITAVVLAGIAYYIYALATETGLVGWINAAQQSLFGSYSLKMSALGLLFVMMPAGGLLWAIASGLGWLAPDPKADRAMFGNVGQPGQPITYLLKVDRLSELDPYAATQRAARDAASLPVLRVRLDGEPPVPAVQHLAKNNVPMASPRHLLRIAPVTNSLAAEAELRDAWQTVLIGCGLITGIVLVAFPLLAWRLRGMAHKAAA